MDATSQVSWAEQSGRTHQIGAQLRRIESRRGRVRRVPVLDVGARAVDLRGVVARALLLNRLEHAARAAGRVGERAAAMERERVVPAAASDRHVVHPAVLGVCEYTLRVRVMSASYAYVHYDSPVHSHKLFTQTILSHLLFLFVFAST